MDKYDDIRLRALMKMEPKADTFFRLCIIEYELGGLVKAILYARRFPEDEKAHMAEAKIALGDVFVQLSILCRELGFSEDELREFGLNRLEVRYKEFEEDKWKPIG